MPSIHWSIEKLSLPLRYTWKISRNATDEKTNLIVRCANGSYVGKGEAAPNIRYGESPELLLTQFERFANTAPPDFASVDELQAHCHQCEVAYALRFAIESAWYHLRAGGRREQLQRTLNVEFIDHSATSYTIPIMEPGVVKSFYDNQRLKRFPYIKLKVNRELAEDLTRQVVSFSNAPVMLDANEAFTDVEDCIRFLEKIKKLPLELVEQPLPSSMREESTYLKKYCPFPLFADEAITHDPDFEWLLNSFDGINMKLMKAGGYSNGLRILREARHHRLRTMIGCMVETSLGISSALNIISMADYVDLDSFILLQKEPFGLLTEFEGRLSFNDSDRL